MKLMALLCFMILGILFACKKDKTIKKDEIINHTFSPALAFHTVRNFTSINNPSCQTNIPTPSDSTTAYLLDINEDQIPDFKFDLSHSKHTGSYCGPCDVYTYSIAIEGISTNNQIACSNNAVPTATLLNDTDLVISSNWQNRAQLVLLEGCALPYHTDFTSGYIGVKVSDSFGYIQIEKLPNNGIKISKIGFNKTKNNAIKCGQ